MPYRHKSMKVTTSFTLLLQQSHYILFFVASQDTQKHFSLTRNSLMYGQYFVVKCCWYLSDTSSMLHMCLVYVFLFYNYHTLTLRPYWHAGGAVWLALTFTQGLGQSTFGSLGQHPQFWYLPSWSSPRQHFSYCWPPDCLVGFCWSKSAIYSWGAHGWEKAHGYAFKSQGQLPPGCMIPHIHVMCVKAAGVPLRLVTCVQQLTLCSLASCACTASTCQYCETQSLALRCLFRPMRCSTVVKSQHGDKKLWGWNGASLSWMLVGMLVAQSSDQCTHNHVQKVLI